MNKNILREYDIRGKYPIDVDEDVAFLIGFKYGHYLKKKFDTIIVGCDVRLSSESLKSMVIKGIISSGVNVYDLGVITTPMCAFSTIKFKRPAIMVTASHNPKDENGFKFFLDNNVSLCGSNLRKFYKTLDKKSKNCDSGNITKFDIYPHYKKEILSKLKFGKRKLNVVVDPGNGAASLFIKDIFKNIPCNAKFICDKPDGLFPNHHPDPSQEKNMSMLKQKVLETEADFGVAYDGDADRVGLVDNKGNFIPSDKIMMIFNNHLNFKKTVFDVKCTMLLKRRLNTLNRDYVMYKTGSPLIKEYINENNIEFGGEFSGHLFFNDKYLGIDDGIYSSLRLIEIFSNIETNVSDEFINEEKLINSGEVKIKTTDEEKFLIIDKLKEYCHTKGYEFIDVDGVRIEDNDYMVVARASNTGPNISFTVEANSKEIYQKKYKEFMKILEVKK